MLLAWTVGASLAVAVPSPPGPRLRPTPAMMARAAPKAPLRSRGGGPLSAEDKARRNAVVEQLLLAEARATEHPETAEPALLAALQAFADIAPLVAEDDYAQSARTYAQLALARTRLVLDQPASADDALDAALRTARGTPLPAAQFGPTLVAAHDERAAVLGALAPAGLEVRCVAPCRVWVDEQPYADQDLLPGHHRVWVEAEAAGVPVLRVQVELTPGERRTIDYDHGPPPDTATTTEPTATPELTPAEPTPAEPRRMLPRFVTIVGLVSGTAMVGAGAGLVAVDHRCPDLRDPRELPQCLRILNTDAGGYTLIGLGGALMVTSAVLLTIDELRGRRAKTRAAHARRARLTMRPWP